MNNKITTKDVFFKMTLLLLLGQFLRINLIKWLSILCWSIDYNKITTKTHVLKIYFFKCFYYCF